MALFTMCMFHLNDIEEKEAEYFVKLDFRKPLEMPLNSQKFI